MVTHLYGTKHFLSACNNAIFSTSLNKPRPPPSPSCFHDHVERPVTGWWELAGVWELKMALLLRVRTGKNTRRANRSVATFLCTHVFNLNKNGMSCNCRRSVIICTRLLRSSTFDLLNWEKLKKKKSSSKLWTKNSSIFVNKSLIIRKSKKKKS